MLNFKREKPVFNFCFGRFTSKLALAMCVFTNLHTNLASVTPPKTEFQNPDGLLYDSDFVTTGREESGPVFVQIVGNPEHHSKIKLKLATSDLLLNFDLQRAEPVAHLETLIVTVVNDPASGRPMYNVTYLAPDILAYTNAFFHNIGKGTSVSVTRQTDGEYHIEGHLTHRITITPTKSADRQRRAVRQVKTHTLYFLPEDRDRDMADSDTLTLALGNSLLNSVQTKNTGEKEWSEMKKLNNLLVDDWSREHKENLEEEAEVDLEDDYLEVPSIFASEEAWKAHQSQAEAASNTVHEKEDEEDQLSYLGFYKRGKGGKIRKNRKRREMEQDSQPNEAKIFVDRSLRIKRRFMTNVKQENIVNNELKIFQNKAGEITKDYHSDKVRRPTQTLLVKTDKDEKYSTGIITKPFKSDRAAYEILNEDFVQVDQKHQYFEDGSTHSIDEKAKLRMEISKNTKSFKTKQRHRRQLSPDTKDVPKVGHDRPTENFRRENSNFVVEVAAVVDVSIYREFNYDWKQLQIFLLHFWQSVNVRFQALVDPKVQLKLKSINKIMFDSMQPFIERNRISPMSDRVRVASVLEDFRSYVSEHYESNPQMPDHDVAILLTGEDLCKKKPDGTWSKSSRGIAFVQGACISSRRFRNQTYDVGVAEVGRSYRGVLTTAHEVGHLLGAFHDGEKSSRSCPSNSGHLMSRAWSKPYLYNRFSQCSRENFRNFMRNTWYSDCLLSSDTRYTQSLTAPNTWPGQLMPLERQCHYYIGGEPCRGIPLESQCGRLCCEKWSQPFPSNEPAADGTTCGPSKMCFNGECLHKYALPTV